MRGPGGQGKGKALLVRTDLPTEGENRGGEGRRGREKQG